MKDSKEWIDERAPKHLSTTVLSGALYIYTGKDTQEKIRRTDNVLNKIGVELTRYALGLLDLPQLLDNMRDSNEYKEFKDNYQSHTLH